MKVREEEQATDEEDLITRNQTIYDSVWNVQTLLHVCGLQVLQSIDEQVVKAQQ